MKDVIKDLSEAKIDYVLPTRRNSHYYDVRIHLTEHFRYHKRLIECGKRKVEEIYLYKFEDLDLKLEETKTLYVSPTDLRPAADHRYGASVTDSSGLYLDKATGVLVEGLTFTGFYPAKDRRHYYDKHVCGVLLNDSNHCVIRNCAAFLRNTVFGQGCVRDFTPVT